MSQLLIELNNPADEALLVRLVDRLQGRVLSKTDTTEDRKQRLMRCNVWQTEAEQLRLAMHLNGNGRFAVGTVYQMVGKNNYLDAELLPGLVSHGFALRALRLRSG